MTLNIVNENDKKDAFGVLDAAMKNLSDAINELQTGTLYDERSATVVGTSVVVSADANSDIQDFTLNVTQLATKQIEQSGSFGTSGDLIATAAGSLNLNVDGQDFTINYDATTTLDDLKKAINDVAGIAVDATIVQIANGDNRLFISSAQTGTTQDITLTDTSGFLSDDGGVTAGGTKLTSGFTVVQTGVDANFEFNGQAITRTSNQVDDLVTGYKITLSETGSSTVSVAQNRDQILERVDSFITQYNAAMKELNDLTKVSTDSAERGIFSSESTIKSMKSALEGMIGSVGGGVGTLYDYGIDVDKDGIMSVDKVALEAKLDANPANVQAFFTGGAYDNGDGTTTTLSGAFVDMFTTIDTYTGIGGYLSEYKDSINTKISTLEDRKLSAVESLDSKYEILKKKYAAYDALIASFNRSGDIFTQLLANQQNN
ncbi:MAG: flagellar filament capping protein FliD [Sulfurimonas sp.]|nr:flagellar filament capping protein FliD [Sulfurimonas sp.]